MPQTLDALLPVLRWILVPGVAAGLSSIAIDELRGRFPVETAISRGPFVAFLLSLFWSPRWTRWTAQALAIGLVVAAQALLSWATGRDVLVDVDAILSATIAAIAGQLLHSFEKPTALPAGLTIAAAGDETPKE
ncbi:MAG: hypothetical protein IPO81_09475 [Kouleothrix sp.]|nr:hypothetical protein [Kouleothrix sp.]